MSMALMVTMSALVCVTQTDVAPGPKAGDKVATLKVSAVVGPWAGKEVDVAAERKGADTIYVFVTQGHWDRPAARYLKALEAGLAKTSAAAQLVVVWLTDQPEQTKDYLRQVQQSIRLGEKVTLGVCTDKGGPSGWNISETDRLTTVVAHGGKVAASFA